MARFVQYTQLGGPEVLHVVEGEMPSPEAGEVVVEVKAAGINPIDAKLRDGRRASSPITAPRTAGLDGAGVIVAVGEGVDGWVEGDEVIVTKGRGTYATHVCVPVDGLTRKPGALSWAQAAGLGIPAGTAYQALRSLGVTEGMTVLVHAASGSVGQAAVQFARELGATVIGTAGPANQERVRQLGAIPTVYGGGLVERVHAISPAGVDRVLDAVGTDDAIRASFELVDDRSHIGTIVRGADADSWGIQAWSGGSPHPLTAEQEAWRAEGIALAAQLAAEGRFDVEIARAFPLDAVVEATELAEQGSARGKIVLLP